MPYVTDDDSKAVKRIAEIEQELQERKAELDEWVTASEPPSNAAAMAQRERATKALTDRIQALATALDLQRSLASAKLHAHERRLAKSWPKKMKDFGYRPLTVQFLGGQKIELMARYWCRSATASEKGRGCCFGLMLLGVCDHCTPALASEVGQLAAALSSFDDAQARLRQMGVPMSINRIAKVSYHFSQRARRQQEVHGMGIDGTLAGKQVVISLDGGRIRIRRTKRGKKTKKGRSRYHTDWREPKLLVIYVVNEKGRISQEFAPVIDGTLQGPDAVFRLLELYLSQLEITDAKKILFIADGARWIWLRVAPLLHRLGLEGRYRQLVDFYHVIEHVNALAALRTSWRSPERKRWVSRQRSRLWRGEVKAFIAEVEKFCQGRRGQDWIRERDYLLGHARGGRLDYAKARRAKLPMGSGTMESAIRRVVNLRLKGASIFWTEEHAEQMLLLRTYYKAKRWEVLETKALATPLAIAA
jgi:hypothetical protein